MKNLKLIELLLEAFINQFSHPGMLGNEERQNGIVEGLQMSLVLVRKEIEKMRDK